MARFFVGQRVRVRRADNHPNLVGLETRIIGNETSNKNGKDCWLLDLKINEMPFTHVLCQKDVAGDYLEPILPDHQACDDDFKRDLDRLLERQGIAA